MGHRFDLSRPHRPACVGKGVGTSELLYNSDKTRKETLIGIKQLEQSTELFGNKSYDTHYSHGNCGAEKGRGGKAGKGEESKRVGRRRVRKVNVLGRVKAEGHSSPVVGLPASPGGPDS